MRELMKMLDDINATNKRRFDWWCHSASASGWRLRKISVLLLWAGRRSRLVGVSVKSGFQGSARWINFIKSVSIGHVDAISFLSKPQTPFFSWASPIGSGCALNSWHLDWHGEVPWVCPFVLVRRKQFLDPPVETKRIVYSPMQQIHATSIKSSNHCYSPIYHICIYIIHSCRYFSFKMKQYYHRLIRNLFDIPQRQSI